MKPCLSVIAMMLGLANVAQADSCAAEVWVDNWFSMSVNGTQVAEDSVSITTERSFNAEKFTFEAARPFVVGLTLKDFKENDTGLEYIGTRRQQMGDGGAIVQMHGANGDLVAVTGSDWQCLTVHKAPLDTACVDEPPPGGRRRPL